MNDIWVELKSKMVKGHFPGLSIHLDKSDFVVLVSVPNHKDNELKLLNLDNSDNDNIHVGGNVYGQIIHGNGNIVG